MIHLLCILLHSDLYIKPADLVFKVLSFIQVLSMDPQSQPTPFHFTYTQAVNLVMARVILLCRRLYQTFYKIFRRTVYFFKSQLKNVVLSICVVILLAMTLQNQMTSSASRHTQKSSGLFDNAVYIGDDAMAVSLRKALDALDIASKKGIDPPIFVIGDNNDPLSRPIFIRIEDLKNVPFDVFQKYVHPHAYQYPWLSPVFEPERRAHLHAQYRGGRW